MKPEDLALLRELKDDALAAFAMIGILSNPSLSYLKPDEVAQRSIDNAAALKKLIDPIATPNPEPELAGHELKHK